MRKSIVLSICFFLLTSCTLPISIDDTDFDEEVAVRVAVAQTTTALAQSHNNQTQTSPQTTLSPSVTPGATPSPTTGQDDPKLTLGSAAWKDTLNSGNYWGLNAGGTTINDTVIIVKDGYLTMSRTILGLGKTWWKASPKPRNFYLEGRFTLQNCFGDDQYGLVFRAPSFEDGNGYYYMVSCDGQYTLLKWDSNGQALLMNWEKSEAIQAGADKINDLGIWVKNNTIILYANGNKLKEINDGTITTAGYFGLVMDARNTPGFTVKLDEISYWDLS